VMIVYDVTNKASFENVKQWMQDLYRYAPEDVELLLVGNKCDEVRAVDYQVAKEFADSAGIPLIETSAKTSVNVDQAFTFLIKRLLSKRYGGATISMVVNSHTHTHTPEREITLRLIFTFASLVFMFGTLVPERHFVL
jgi:Ras-related protein Rab-1A